MTVTIQHLSESLSGNDARKIKAVRSDTWTDGVFFFKIRIGSPRALLGFNSSAAPSARTPRDYIVTSDHQGEATQKRTPRDGSKCVFVTHPAPIVPRPNTPFRRQKSDLDCHTYFVESLKVLM